MTEPTVPDPQPDDVECEDVPKLTAEEWAYIAEIEDSEPEDDA
jgi:hypothetical protein